MNRVKVQQTIEVYEVNGVDVPIGQKVELGIDSHWPLSQRIVLNIRGVKYTVIGRDLITAVQNAMNTG